MSHGLLQFARIRDINLRSALSRVKCQKSSGLVGLSFLGTHARAVQKVSDLWSAKIRLFILTSETLIPFRVVSLVMHTLIPAVLPLL